MDVVDMHDPSRVARRPDGARTVLSGRFEHGGVAITRVELRLYREWVDPLLGQYSLLTSLVATDSGSVEMIYDEGFRGDDPLEAAAGVLAGTGVSGLVGRSLIALRGGA